jgi:hypothetical protein
MAEGRINQVVRLRLLALVLALALTWYALNPAPSPARRVRKGREDEPPENRRGAESASAPSLSQTRTRVGMRSTAANRPARAEGEAGELDWPEFIDLRES